MSITKEVLRIAKLAKLHFSDQKLDDFTNQFSQILAMVEKLQMVNCDGVEPLKSINNIGLVMRDDEITDGQLQDKLFTNTPGKQADLAKEVHCFVVPKVIE